MAINEERKAENIRYEDFLTKGREVCSPRLLIGNFQRNYVWAPKHIRKLIDCISENDAGYYLGNIVTQIGKAGAGGRDIVVDGQQRLVTLSLISLALANRLEKATAKTVVDRILYDDPTGNKRSRISFARAKTTKCYEALISGKKLRASADSLEKRLYDRYTLIEELLKSITDLDEFLDKVRRLEFVVIKCPSLHDVNKLYEGLNSHGQKLSPAEQTKNLLLGLLENSKNIQKIWEKLESKFEKSKPLWFDKFLRHQWFSIGGYTSNAALFDDIREHLKKHKVSVYSRNLVLDSDMYIKLRRAEFVRSTLSKSAGMEREAIVDTKYMLDCIRAMNVDQVYAVLLAMAKYGKSNSWYSSNDVFFRDVEKVWCFMVLAKYSNISPSAYERIFADFCYKIGNLHYSKKDYQKFIQDNLFTKLAGLVATTRATFIDNANKQLKYSTDPEVSSNDKQYVAALLMGYLSSGEYFIPSRRSSIEHIIPQGKLVNWTKISNRARSKIETDKRYRLGNLTLIARSKKDINTKIGNLSFTRKYDYAYEKDSVFPRNAGLAVYKREFESSNPAVAVEKRGIAMATELYASLRNKLTR